MNVIGQPFRKLLATMIRLFRPLPEDYPEGYNVGLCNVGYVNGGDAC